MTTGERLYSKLYSSGIARPLEPLVSDASDFTANDARVLCMMLDPEFGIVFNERTREVKFVIDGITGSSPLPVQ